MKDKERKKKDRYTLEEKIAVLNLLKYKISKHSIEKDFGIERKTIRSSEEKKDQIMNGTQKKSFQEVVESQ